MLILIFMVIQTSLHRRGFETEIPQPADEAIVIQLLEGAGKDDTPSVKINSEEASWDKLELRLFDIYKQRTEKVAFVEGDDGVEFRLVADVIDQAREAGVETIGLMPKRVAAK